MRTRSFLCVLMFSLTLLTASAQTTGGNGGQAAENNYARFTYIGYSSGHYVVTLQNKQTCSSPFTINWLGKDTVITVANNSTVTFNLPGAAVGGTKIKSKPQNQCTASCDMGWLEIWSPQALPMHFTSFTAKKVNKY